MRISRETRYDADPEAVFAMLTDEDFLRRRAMAAHASSHDVSVVRVSTPSSTVVQTLPVELPDIARRLVGDSVTLTEVITWSDPEPDRSRPATIAVDVQGVPLTLRGTLTLSTGATGGTVQVVEAEMKASIPVIGKKIEEAAAPAVLAGIDSMGELGRAWLSGAR